MNNAEALRSTIIDILVATRGESEGHTADAILLALTDHGYVRVPDGFATINENLRTQNNRSTQDPLFVVFEKRSIVVDEDFDHDSIVWCDGEGNDASDQETEQLDAIRDDVDSGYYLYDQIDLDGSEWCRLAVKEYDSFITACFTDAGAQAYLKANGHNLKKPFIYVTSLYRNDEMKHLREWLMQLTAKENSND